MLSSNEEIIHDKKASPIFPDLARLVARAKARLHKGKDAAEAMEDDEDCETAAMEFLMDEPNRWDRKEGLDLALLGMASDGYGIVGETGGMRLNSGTPRSPECLALAWSETTPEERLLAECMDGRILRRWLSASFRRPNATLGFLDHEPYEPTPSTRTALSDAALSFASSAPTLRRALRSKFIMNLLDGAGSHWDPSIKSMGRIGSPSPGGKPFAQASRLIARRVGSAKTSAATILGGFGSLAVSFAGASAAQGLGAASAWIGGGFAAGAAAGVAVLGAGAVLQCLVQLRGGAALQDPERAPLLHARGLLALAYPDFEQAHFFDANLFPGDKPHSWTLADPDSFVGSLALLGLDSNALRLLSPAPNGSRLGAKSYWSRHDRGAVAAMIEARELFFEIPADSDANANSGSPDCRPPSKARRL